MNLWPRAVWETDLSLAELQSRLVKVTDEDALSRWFRFADKGTVYRAMTDRSCRLFAKGSALVHNSFEPYFYGSFVQTQRGTTLQGVFRPHTSVVSFMAVWFAFISVVGGALNVASLVALIAGTMPRGNLPPGAALVVWPALLASGMGIAAIGWRMGRGQRERIRTLIDATLADRLIRGSSGPQPHVA